MCIRMIDYYVKHLPFDARQDIFAALDQINPLTIEKILEKVKGYPRYRSVGYTDEDIANQLRKMTVRFENVNRLMVKYNRPPLFADTTDAYACSLRFVEIMRRYRDARAILPCHLLPIAVCDPKWLTCSSKKWATHGMTMFRKHTKTLKKAR